MTHTLDIFQLGCGGDNPEQFEGLIMLDECHKASNIDLDNDGNACNVGKSTLCSQTAAKVVELQALLPRARVVYCSATSVSEPRNLGFMSRLGEDTVSFVSFIYSYSYMTLNLHYIHFGHVFCIRLVGTWYGTPKWLQSIPTGNRKAWYWSYGVACNSLEIHWSNRCTHTELRRM